MKDLQILNNIKKINKDNILYLLKALKKKDIPCPYCRNKKKAVYGKRYIFFDICRCQKCKLFFINPIYLSDKNIEKFYNDHYFSPLSPPDVKEFELIDKESSKRYAYDYSNILIAIRKLVSGNRLLEFGSSWGYFLLQAQAFGFYPIGVEISEKRAQFGYRHLGVDIFSDIDLIKDRFNVICTFHTLEHLVDLREIFNKFYERLLPNGSLIIEVPNVDPERNGKPAYLLMGKVHALGFSKDFFENNLPRHGFSEIDIAGNLGDLLKKPEERRPLRESLVLHARRL